MVLEVPRVSSELGKHRFQLLCPSGLELPTGLSKTWLFVAYIAWTVVLRASLEMRSHTDLSYCLFIVLCRDLSQKACVCCMAKVSSTNTVRYLTPYTWGCLKLSVLRDSRDIKQMDTRWKTIYCVNPKWHTCDVCCHLASLLGFPDQHCAAFHTDSQRKQWHTVQNNSDRVHSVSNLKSLQCWTFRNAYIPHQTHHYGFLHSTQTKNRFNVLLSCVPQRSEALHLSARGATTVLGSNPGCITSGRDWESYRAAHNWPSVVQVWPSL
jgi:hypothetical protein